MRTGNAPAPIRKKSWVVRSAMVAAAFSASTLSVASRTLAAPPSEEDLGRLALAEEFASAGVNAVNQQKQVSPAMVRQSAALLRAACEEWKFDPRFPRLLTEACLQLKDWEGAITAIELYRAIQLPEVQNDQFAQVQLIDLATDKAETLDKKLDYLKRLLGVTALPDPVRSHIAWKCANLLTQKFDSGGSQAMLTMSLKLNPLNPEALQSEYVAAQASGDLARKARALVALLKSNPAQPLVMGALADELASVGLPDLAVTWYKRSFLLSQQVGLGLDAGRYLNYAAALYAMDQTSSANDASNMLLASQPSNIGAATIGLLVARAATRPGGVGGDADQVQHARDTALAALSAQMGTLHARLHGVTGAAATQAATTQPQDLIGDIAGDSPKVRDLKNKPDVSEQQNAFCTGYAAALADLIFYYTYFDPQPAKAGPLLDALRSLRPADDAELTRLEGFAFLADGKRDEAKVKFSAIADHDPLAAMGLLLMEPASSATAAQATKLASDHPAGLLSAILLDGLRDKGAKPTATADAAAVSAESTAFPLKLLDLLDRAHTPDFYNLVAEPLHVSRGFDEPALVRVSIKNIGDYDLSVGNDCAIRPDLWFDVAVQGGNNPTFAGVSYDRIAGPLVLKAHQLDTPGTDQVVRVDTGPLHAFLKDRPTPAISMLFSVFTNPVGQQAGVAPGPGGYRKQVSSPMERRSAPISTSKEISDLESTALNGRIDEKIHTFELLADYVKLLKGKINSMQKPPLPAAVGDQPPAANTGDTDAGAGVIAPPPPPVAAAPAPVDAKPDPAFIQQAQGLIVSFTSTIRSALRDPSPTVRYWAQTKLAELADPASRQATAQSMVQGKDWQERMLGLMLANELPADAASPIAVSLKNDTVDFVKNFADATIEIGYSPPSTAP